MKYASLQFLISSFNSFFQRISFTSLFLQDELEAELEELEGAELEEQLLQPATIVPAAQVVAPGGRQQARPASQKNTSEEDELAALQAEMAL